MQNCKIRSEGKTPRFDDCPGCVGVFFQVLKGTKYETSSKHIDYFGVYGTGRQHGIFMPILTTDAMRAMAQSVIDVCDDIDRRMERPVAPKDPLPGVAGRNRPAELPYDTDIDG